MAGERARLRDNDAIQCSLCRTERRKDGLDLTSQILHVQERIIMTDGYGPPALLLFWIGLAAFYAPRIRRVCSPGLRRVLHSIPRPAILTLSGRRR